MRGSLANWPNKHLIQYKGFCIVVYYFVHSRQQYAIQAIGKTQYCITWWLLYLRYFSYLVDKGAVMMGYHVSYDFRFRCKSSNTKRPLEQDLVCIHQNA